MRTFAQILSWLSLAALLAVPFTYLAGATSLPTVKLWMLVFTIVWFVTVPVWMDRKPG